ncbi:hemerythrin domain-containing protein [Sphingomonas baiyangensis]|uniref:Hemerythrin domain-containing protein n=1 Tax=Sphingomonas baiyangensis TaxID=2572576 RepID=A0A4U1L7K5_9SPHN|nr:hemerythrin domain-containing protein [Sphingomonas baiyangensis]TKD52901.1 hemerythrin domain-containing protein [Sphingomonas baiyangensis]
MADARIFEDLKQDHDRHREMLKTIDKADAGERADLFEAFRVEVSAHAAAEEESLYATMLAKPDLRDEARHSVAEHKEIDDFFEEMADLDAASDEWKEKFDEMRHRYEHHIDEEEEDMFPAAADDLSKDETARLAKVFEKRKPKELAIAEESEAGDDRD